MTYINLGWDADTHLEVGFPSEDLSRHLHLIGSTGSGKTTTILSLIRQLLISPHEKACVFVIDPMGNLSMDFLRWLANKRYCTDGVRKRLLYIEPAREDSVLPFNPLLNESPAHEYYQIERTISLILRAWESQDLSAMPRLRKWCFNAFLAVARLQLPMANCQYLLQPGSPEHEALLKILPPEVKHEWYEILNSRGSEAIKILDSTRNRLDPFFRSIILKRMFGSRRSNFDVPRLITERRIVIINLAGKRRLPPHLSGTLGALILNEIMESAMSMSPSVVRPTYVLLDEFQHFIGPDIYDAIPTVRQQGIRLILSHQSFSQLEQGEVDLTGLIWQPRNRLAFACDADDADRLAHELATLTYDPMTIKYQMTAHRQRIAGYRKDLMRTWSSSFSDGSTHETSHGRNRSGQRQETRNPGDESHPIRSSGRGEGVSDNLSQGRSKSHSESEGWHEVNVPIQEDVEELSSVTFKSFEEEKLQWAKVLRTQPIGNAVAKFLHNPMPIRLIVDEDPIPDSESLQAAVQELIAKNFESDFFVSAASIDNEAEQIRLSLFETPKIIVQTQPVISLDTNSSRPVIDASGLE